MDIVSGSIVPASALLPFYLFFEKRKNDFQFVQNESGVERFLLMSMTNLCINYLKRKPIIDLGSVIIEEDRFIDFQHSENDILIKYETALERSIENLDTEIKEF